MPPRRARPFSQAQPTEIQKRQQQQQQQHPQHDPPSRPPTQPPNLGMSPEARYAHNLKVLRRRDPSIVSIFDQFSHVCLYHHNGKKWEKKGFEGSMFLFEREAYPLYGFYILNRMGMEDYIQPMYPEDDVEAQGSYLLYRSYPDFTARRLGIPASTLRTTSEDYSSGQEEGEEDEANGGEGDSKKGRSLTVGLWMFATDSREPLTDVMIRLHKYISQNQPYPEKFKYGPDRPPPPNPHLRPSNQSSPEPTPQAASSSSKSKAINRVNYNTHTASPIPPTSSHRPPAQSHQAHLSQSHPAQQGQPCQPSELDKLFAKLQPPPPPQPSKDVVVEESSPTSSASAMTVDSLFASLLGPTAPGLSKAPVPQAPVVPEAPPAAPHRGLALLNTIFASATPSPPVSTTSRHNPSLTLNLNGTGLYQPQTQPSPPTNRQQHNPEILSPKPTSSTLPPLLNQSVMSSLLGIPPSPTSTRVSGGASRSSSASGSASAPSTHYRYEGDNEGSEGHADSEVEFSESSTVLDPDPTLGPTTSHHGPAATRDLGDLAVYVQEMAAQVHQMQRDMDTGAYSLSLPPHPQYLSHPQHQLLPHNGLSSEGEVGVNGDVTPRPPFKGMPTATPPSVARDRGQVTRSPPGSVLQGGLRGERRELLAPASRTITMTSTSSTSTVRPSFGQQSQSPSQVQSQTEQVQRSLVPFESASDLWPYPRAPLDDRSYDQVDDVVELDFEDTSALSDPEVFSKRLASKKIQGGKDGGKDKGKNHRMGRKERMAEKEREKEEIEKGWDDPVKGQVHTTTLVHKPSTPMRELVSTPSPAHSPFQALNGKGKQPGRNVLANGTGRVTPKGSHPATNGVSSPIDREAAKDALLNSLFSSAKIGRPKGLERKEFVTELLTLLHTDKTFVDQLYQDYETRSAR
ncbi:hypothetical protein JAAARDRAFT_191720 [Jaapia argillacea MUCL 33604]|uniref:mRNA-decapping enzyme C-terminal domain-containing protein n=1 Tax=Jaapia argillacea MUCL 33604 TaxID=933084 RepID=A0A067PZT4_9AGAM|nr:hypothetical protein JAAARDRAFT_191720 [Jaapia argillacea MUCL 33604]